MSGCKRPPDQVIKNVKLISYSKDGISYSKEINAFSFFDQFRETDVILDFTSKDFTLICFDKRYSGTWEEVEESKEEVVNTNNSITSKKLIILSLSFEKSISITSIKIPSQALFCSVFRNNFYF